VLCVNASVLATHKDPGLDYPSLLKGGMSQLVSKPYEYNTSLMAIFQKPTVRIRLDAHIRTLVVLTGGKLIGIYFLHLISITMHRQQGKYPPTG
jgi:hypothetical protein